MESRIALSDSNDLSGTSSMCCVINTENPFPSPSYEASAPDIAALKRLSENIESIFDSSQSTTFSDAKIIVSSGKEIPVHRCILSTRSPFFKIVFSGLSRKESKLELKDLAKDMEIGYDSAVVVLAYLYSGRVRALPRTVCSCVDEECDHVACRPSVNFLLEVLYVSYVFQVSELVTLYQRHLLAILHKVPIDNILGVASSTNMCGKACERLLAKCIEIIVKSNIEYVSLEKSLPSHLVKEITDTRALHAVDCLEDGIFPNKHVRRIHRALDSDDVELVKLLLTEGHTTLDDAHALHYAVAYCDAKTTTELLDFGLADVNHRNSRGSTVLHVAALRNEPKIIVSLLTKGARLSDRTSDGRKALQISKSVTRAFDYYKPTEEGKPTPRDRLCIEILEQAERRDPLLGEASVSLAIAGDDLRLKMLYLENRVGLAKLLFPMEAKVAMDIAQVDGTFEFPIDVGSSNLNRAQRTIVDLNDAPFKIKDEHLNRMRALSKTVELGKCFFPRCSEVLNKIMDADDLSELACASNDTPKERNLKRKRYIELQDILSKAFTEDKEDFNKSGISSSSSTSAAKSNGKLTHKK